MTIDPHPQTPEERLVYTVAEAGEYSGSGNPWGIKRYILHGSGHTAWTPAPI
jgi:hypothetical protein